MSFQPELTSAEVASALPCLASVTAVVSGGQGAVFKATHPAHGECAVKIYLPWSGPRVAAEATFLQSVAHSSVVSVFEYGTVVVRGDATPYVIMNFIEGESLRDMLNAGRTLDEAAVRKLLKQSCEVLKLLSDARKVHRDIKPDNIVVGPTGTFTLLDFGIARHLDLATMTIGRMPGTPSYEAPEQSAGVRTLTVKCDVFALGVTAFETLTAIHPFGRRQDAINQGVPPLQAQPLCQCSDELSDLLGRMMQFRPVWRPQPDEVISILGG